MFSSQPILTLLCLFGALQGLLLAITVASLREGLARANKALALILLGSSAAVATILLSHRPGIGDGRTFVLVLELLEYSLWMFIGPLYYAYVSLVVGSSDTGRDRISSRWFLLHFVPGIVWLAYLALWLVGSSRIAGAPPWLPPVTWMMLYQLLYTGLVIWKWRSARQIEGLASSIGLHSFWVPALLLVLVAQHGAQLTRWLFRHNDAFRDVVPLVGAGSFVIVTVIGLRRALAHLAQSRRRYTGSSLSPERSREISERLLRMMESDRPYLEPDLSLDDLAARLEVPKTHLSQAINERLGQKLPELLSGFRVRESERLLCDRVNDHLTIEAIGGRSGFKSRSAFYEAFRRQTGITPNAYRKRSASSRDTA